jgi:hypothetical protein
MAQAVDEPALRHDLHPGADTRSTGAKPHQAEVAILKCFENSAKRRRWHLFRAALSNVYLRTSKRSLLCSDVHSFIGRGSPAEVIVPANEGIFPNLT